MSKLDLYEKVRDQINTGDLLLWKSHSALGFFIRLFSKASVNHAGLAVRLFGITWPRVFTIEALEKGVQPYFLSSRLEEFDGEVWWYPLCNEWDKFEIRQEIEERMWKHVGIKYDYPSLFKNAIRKVEADDKLLFCSEAAFLELGFTGTAPTPGDIPGLKIFKEPVRIL
jgi:hypothetical protein